MKTSLHRNLAFLATRIGLLLRPRPINPVSRRRDDHVSAEDDVPAVPGSPALDATSPANTVAAPPVACAATPGTVPSQPVAQSDARPHAQNGCDTPVALDTRPTPPPVNTDALQMACLIEEMTSLRSALESGLEQAVVVTNQAESLKILSHKLRAIEEDFLFDRALKPVFLELLIVLDDLAKAQAVLDAAPPHTGACQILKGIETQILQLLARYDIWPMASTPNTFDPACQRVVGVHRVDPVKSGKIEAKVRPGYRMKERVLRYEEVVTINQGKE